MRVNRIAFATALVRADINLKTLVSRSGLSRSTITAIKSGKSCSETSVKKLAQGLGVSVSEILAKEA